MSAPLHGEALKQLRHDLRTPINHILGYTDMLVEDAREIGIAEFVAPLCEIRAGGRALLELIQTALGEGTSAVDAVLMETFECRFASRARTLLASAQALEGDFQSVANQEARTDIQRVVAALKRLLAMSDNPPSRGAETGVEGGAPSKAASEFAPALASAPAHASPPAPAPASPLTPAHASPPAPAHASPPAPAHASPPTPALLPEPTPAPIPGTAEGGGRILIAEDNSANRDILRRRLEKDGHHVTETQDGAEALEQLEGADFDLLLLDILMPRLNGFETLARIRANQRLRDLPVIMISALDEIQSVVRCIEMGAEDYLPKPIDPVLLRARIGACLEKKRLRDRERRKTAELELALQRLKETQDQLVVQEKMASLGALTAGVAHEIKNPLNFVTNFAVLSVDLMKEVKELMAPVRAHMPPGDAEYLDDLLNDLAGNLDRIRDHGKRADSIVRGMLAHSRGGSGQREAIDLNALVAEAVNLAYHGLRAQDPAFNITLESDYDPSIPPIHVVPQDLSRVILNIANNGCYAAHQRKLKSSEAYRPTLYTSTMLTSTSVEIRIRDNGTGIPQAALQKVFNPFFTTKPSGQGTGLGLSLSYQIVVEQLKGAVRAISKENEFTEFLISLPR